MTLRVSCCAFVTHKSPMESVKDALEGRGTIAAMVPCCMSVQFGAPWYSLCCSCKCAASNGDREPTEFAQETISQRKTPTCFRSCAQRYLFAKPEVFKGFDALLANETHRRDGGQGSSARWMEVR